MALHIFVLDLYFNLSNWREFVHVCLRQPGLWNVSPGGNVMSPSSMKQMSWPATWIKKWDTLFVCYHNITLVPVYNLFSHAVIELFEQSVFGKQLESFCYVFFPGLFLLLIGVRPCPEDPAGRPGWDQGGLQVPGRDSWQASWGWAGDTRKTNVSWIQRAVSIFKSK